MAADAALWRGVGGTDGDRGAHGRPRQGSTTSPATGVQVEPNAAQGRAGTVPPSSSRPRLTPSQKGLQATADRDDLLSTPSSPHTAIDMPERSSSTSPSLAQQRARLLSATDKLSDGQRRLEDSHRVALETEGLGAGILRDLRGQRDTLLHTRDNVRLCGVGGRGGS